LLLKEPIKLVKTLAVLEACVKNCNRRFHLQIAEKQFLAVIERFVNTKTGAGGLAREKALGLIQTWADAFRHDPALGAIRELYVKLLGDGMEFPAQDLDDMAPIVTPRINTELLEAQRVPAVATQPQDDSQRDEEFARELDRQFRAEDAAAAAQAQAQTNHPRQQQLASSAHLIEHPMRGPASHSATAVAASGVPAHGAYRTVHRPMQLAPGERVMATSQQLQKLRSDLIIVRQNSKLLLELLQALGPQDRAQDNELVTEVSTTCKSMQSRVGELLGRVENEDFTGELLEVNDQLNEALHELGVRITQEGPRDPADSEPIFEEVPLPNAGNQPVLRDAGPVSPLSGAVAYQPMSVAGGPSTAASDGGSGALPGYTVDPPDHSGTTGAVAEPGHEQKPMSVPTRAPPPVPGTVATGAEATNAAPPSAESPEFDMFAQTRGISLADQLNSGPSYVTGDELTSEEYRTFQDGQDASLGAAMYHHLSLQDAALNEPDMMATRDIGANGATTSIGATEPASSLYMEVQPTPEPAVTAADYVEVTADSASGVAEAPMSAAPAEPKLYDGGSTRCLDSSTQRALELKHDAMYGL